MEHFNPVLIKRLQKALKQDPKSRSFCTLAQIYLGQNQLEKAKELCLDGLVHHPDELQAHMILGKIYTKQNCLDQAIQSLNTAKKLQVNKVQIYHDLASIYRKQGLLDKVFYIYKLLSFVSATDPAVVSSLPYLENMFCNKPTKNQNLQNTKNQFVDSNKNQIISMLNQYLYHIDQYKKSYS